MAIAFDSYISVPCPSGNSCGTPLNHRLKTLAIRAQKAEPGSEQRRQIVHRLLYILQRSGKLHCTYPMASQALYVEARAIATQQVFCYIYEKIDNYDPSRGEVLQWANFLLKVRFPNALKELTHLGKGLDTNRVTRLLLEDNFEYRNSMQFKVYPQSKNLLQELIALLTDDPHQMFSSVHVHQYPQASFRSIALRKLEGYSWQEISDEFGITVSTLSSFYQRSLKRFSSLLKEYLLDN